MLFKCTQKKIVLNMCTFRTVTSCWSIDVAPVNSRLKLPKSKSNVDWCNSSSEHSFSIGCCNYNPCKLPSDKLASAYLGGNSNRATRISEFFFRLSLFLIDDTRSDKEFMLKVWFEVKLIIWNLRLA